MKKFLHLLAFFQFTGNFLYAQINTYTTNRTSTQITPSTIATKWFNGSDSTNLGLGFSANFQTVNGRLNTALGNFALSNNIDGSFNTALGYRALSTNINSGNTAIGAFAMEQSTNSARNTAIGYEVLNKNLVSYDNVAVGYRAMFQNTYGSSNTAIGNEAHLGGKLDSLNVAIGNLALSNTLNNGPGSKNTAIGTQAMAAGGEEAVAIGYRAGFFNYQEGVSIGAHSQQKSGKNTAIGDSAMYLRSGLKYNTAIGHAAMKNAGTLVVGGLPDAVPEENVAIGENALRGAGGRRNVALGNNAMRKASFPVENVAIGNNAMINFSNSLKKGNTAIGDDALISMTASEYNTVLGYSAAKDLTTGDNNTIIGAATTLTTPTADNLTIIASDFTGGGSNKVIIGNPSVTSIGAFAAYTNLSDKRLKANIKKDNSLGLSFIMGLRTASYYYKNDKNHVRRDGLIAQDVQDLLESRGLYFDGLHIEDNQERTLSLAYDKFVLPLINAHQELSTELEALTTKYEKLQLENEALSSVKEKIEALATQK